jgi:cellulose synthase (UDP-forming)
MAFSAVAESTDISQTAAVLRGTQFTALRVAGNQYRVGENTPLERVTRALQEFPWIVAVVAALFCFLIAVLLQARLRRRARFRLENTE